MKNIDDYKNIFIPIHCNGNHWTLAVINVKQNSLEYYDSLRGDGKVFEAAMQHLQGYLKLKWPRFACEKYIQKQGPMQHNCYDCAVFMCTTADFLSRDGDVDLTFSQSDMPHLRQRMVLQIINEGNKGK